MSSSNAQLMNLPDELLLIIFKKLNNTDVLYSLFDVNIHLNSVIRDHCFTTEINFVNSIDYTSERMETLIDRFCLEILPKIDHLIKCLKVQSTTMERILLAGDYSNLSRLEIFIPHIEPFININDELSLMNRLKHRMLIVSITGKQILSGSSLMTERADLFDYLFKIFINIQYLKFYQPSIGTLTSVNFNSQPSMFSSTLVELHVSLYCFEDFLYLLDGRFNKLRKLVVLVFKLWRLESIQISTEPIINLKELSFTCTNGTDAYDEWIVPTFRRMINLEKLSLYLQIHCQRRFIDGNTLKENFFNHMPRLEDFNFDIRSIVRLNAGQVDLLSDEEIQSTFTGLAKHQVITYVDHFRAERNAHCHFYTYPSLSIEYHYLSNNFRGELLENIQRVELYDERPFEHSFFMRIAQSFPSMKALRVINRTPQQKKHDDQLLNENQRFPVIRYRSLQHLILLTVHDDYLEQFLFHTRTFFSDDLELSCYDGQLKRVTNNFMREETKVNYSKVKSFDLFVDVDYSRWI